MNYSLSCPDDGMCHLGDCNVCDCAESEFPESFKRPHYGLSTDDPICQEGKLQAVVDCTIDSKAFRGWTVTDTPWTIDDETDNCSYHNILAQFNFFFFGNVHLNMCMSLLLLIPVKRIIFKMINCSSVDVNDKYVGMKDIASAQIFSLSSLQLDNGNTFSFHCSHSFSPSLFPPNQMHYVVIIVCLGWCSNPCLVSWCYCSWF